MTRKNSQFAFSRNLYQDTLNYAEKGGMAARPTYADLAGFLLAIVGTALVSVGSQGFLNRWHLN
jgi:hypothetical protein